MNVEFQYICNNPRAIETEQRDCVVRALSLAFNVDYVTVHKMCAKAGRKPKQGMYRSQTNAVIQELTGNKTNVLDILPRGQRQTLATFAKQNNKGNWIVLKSGHAIALIDGVYHDSNTKDNGLPRSIVQAYYKAK